MRPWIIGVLLCACAAAPVHAQEQVVVPTYTPERTCVQSVPVPCEADRTGCVQSVPVPCEIPPPPCPAQYPASVPCAAPRVIHYEMRSPALFWTGAAFIAGGATFVISSFTWGQESVDPGYAAAPCGTEPALTRLPIAPCKVSGPLLAAGVSLMGTGTALMFYGGQKDRHRQRWTADHRAGAVLTGARPWIGSRSIGTSRYTF